MRRLGASDELCRLMLGLFASMAEQNDKLSWRLETALRQLWRRKSEKISPEQMLLFLAKLPATVAAQADVDAAAAIAELDTPSADTAAATDAPAADGAAAPPPQRKRRGKQPLPPHLPRRTVIIPVPDDQRRCACGAERRCIGHDKEELLDFEPASVYVLERLLEKLACKACEEGVTCAASPGKPLEGGRPGAGMLAQITTAKEHDSLPLYRQSLIFKRGGLHLAPSTLGDWHAHSADLYEPIWRFLRGDTLGESHLISLDDTGMPVLDRDDVRGIKKGHIWTFIGDQQRVAFCHYTSTWSGAEIRPLLAEFRGRVIQADGYAGIDEVFTGPDPPARAGCMDHCRRRFVKAMEAGVASAALVVKLLQGLYAIEEHARDRHLGPDALLALRQAKSRPIMDQLQRVIAELHQGAVPKSPLGKATTYAINQWTTLCVFLQDGRVPLSNAHVERQQRRTACGRKNYLFAGSDDGARRLAILQTVVVNCDLLKISMWHYLRDTFQRLAEGWPQSRIAELTPAAWAAEQKAKQTDAQ